MPEIYGLTVPLGLLEHYRKEIMLRVVVEASKLCRSTQSREESKRLIILNAPPVRFA